MNLEPFTGPGSTPSRRRFWDKITAYVIASQKVAGENVSVTEHQGAGTLINVNRVRGLEGGVGACCYDDGTCDDLTEAECNDAEGNWQGSGTTCDDVDCTDCTDGDCRNGACCEGDICTITSPSGCAGDFQGRGTSCEPNPCIPTGTARCCFPDFSCADETEEDCALAGGTFIPGTSCDDSACTCCIIPGAFSPFMDDDGICWTDQTCSGTGFGGEMVPCDSLFLTQLIHCCRGGAVGELCNTDSFNPVTCVNTSEGDCSACDEGGVDSVESPYIPCSSLLGAFDSPFFTNN